MSWQRLPTAHGSIEVTMASWRSASASWIVGTAALAAVGLVDAAQLAAQSHAPKPAAAAPHPASPPQTKGERAAPTHAKDDHAAPTRDTGGHATPARNNTAQPAPARDNASHAASAHDDHGHAAPAASTVHADDDVDRASRPATRRPAAPAAASGNKELDAVMQRINSRISATTGKAVVAPARPHAAPAAAASSAPAKPARGSPAHAAAHDAPGGHGDANVATRSASSPARVSLTWRPSVVWPRAVLDGGDSRVDVAWAPAVH